MVLLGGIQTLSGPIVGATVFALLQDTVMRQTEYWRALLGLIILLLVLLFPGGIAGAVARCSADEDVQRRYDGARRCARCRKAFGGVRAVNEVASKSGRASSSP